jgi:hypothetical protein
MTRAVFLQQILAASGLATIAGKPCFAVEPVAVDASLQERLDTLVKSYRS